MASGHLALCATGHRSHFLFQKYSSAVGHKTSELHTNQYCSTHIPQRPGDTTEHHWGIALFNRVGHINDEELRNNKVDEGWRKVKSQKSKLEETIWRWAITGVP